jgi:hypothetical protein
MDCRCLSVVGVCRTSRLGASTSVGSEAKSVAARWSVLRDWCYRPRSASSRSTEVSFWRSTCSLFGGGWLACLESVVDHGGLLAVRLNRGRLSVQVYESTSVLRLLAIKCFHATRLETRTKESNMCASLWVIETRET